MITIKTIEKHEDYQKALQADCDLVLQRYLLHSTYSFQPFSKIWRDIKFSHIFVGYYNPNEAALFTHMVFHCAKKYFILPNCRYTQTGGLYLLYALYHKQPIKDLIKIRILLNEMQTIKDYVEFMKSENCLEPIFIFNSLLKDTAIEFVCCQHKQHPGTKYSSVDLSLVDNIFLNDGDSIPNEFIKESKNAVEIISSIDNDIMNKLEAYKKKHKDVLIDYDTRIQKELVDSLKHNPFEEKDDAEASTSFQESEISISRTNIVNKSFTADSRSKFIKQLSGEEKLKKKS